MIKRFFSLDLARFVTRKKVHCVGNPTIIMADEDETQTSVMERYRDFLEAEYDDDDGILIKISPVRMKHGILRPSSGGHLHDYNTLKHRGRVKR